MEGKYPILLGQETVGEADVTKEGLYYRFDCRCSFAGESMFRLHAVCDGKEAMLGLPVPEGEGFVLRTKVPAKRLGQGDLSVRAVGKHRLEEGRFIPLSPQEPFAYIAQLKNAYLAKKEGITGVLLKK